MIRNNQTTVELDMKQVEIIILNHVKGRYKDLDKPRAYEDVAYWDTGDKRVSDLKKVIVTIKD